MSLQVLIYFHYQSLKYYSLGHALDQAQSQKSAKNHRLLNDFLKADNGAFAANPHFVLGSGPWGAQVRYV